MVPSRQEHSTDLFEVPCPDLYEKRWTAVYKFMKKCRPRLLILRAVWNAALFRAEDKAAKDAQFEPEMFTQTLRSNLFFAYLDMCLRLNKLTNDIGAWSEGCTCHEVCFIGESQHRRKTFLEQDFGEGIHSCPLQGMRFPELVAGGFAHIPTETYQESLRYLLTDVAIWVSPAEWQVVLSDYSAAFQRFQLVLETKTSFLKKLPWLMGGMAHHDVSTQREFARKSIDAYDSTPEVCNQKFCAINPGFDHMTMATGGAIYCVSMDHNGVHFLAPLSRGETPRA
jgi:hypothetical protein